MATKSRKSKAKRTAAKGSPRKQSKTAKVILLMKRPNGCTREEVLKATGWRAVSMQQLAASAGVKLKIDDKERPYRYRAA